MYDIETDLIIELDDTPTVNADSLNTNPLTWTERVPTIKGICIPDKNDLTAKVDTSFNVLRNLRVVTLWFSFQSKCFELYFKHCVDPTKYRFYWKL